MVQLMRYVMTVRNNFIHCDYTAEADIFALLENGSFDLECDREKFCVNAGILKKENIISETQIHSLNFISSGLNQRKNRFLTAK